MKAVLFVELSLIFASSFLLTTQLFYNCLNETHFLAIGGAGVVLALVIVLAGYKPTQLTVVLYGVLALAAFGYLLFTVGVGYIVYNFGPDSRTIFIEKEIRNELKSLHRHAERSQEAFGDYSAACRQPGFATVPGDIALAYQKESCYGPLAFLIFDTSASDHQRYTCGADASGWYFEVPHPSSDGFLCVDERRQVVFNTTPITGGVSCR